MLEAKANYMNICEPLSLINSETTHNVKVGFLAPNPSGTYVHRSFPYKSALKDNMLRSRLKSLFQPVIANAV